MRRQRYTKSFVLFALLLVFPQGGEGFGELSNVSLPRSPRAIDGSYKYLIFPQGSNVQLVYCMTIGALAKPQGVFTLGVTAGLAYELPYRRTVPFRKPAEVYHRRSRRDLYNRIEIMLRSQGKDGRSCVLKALCQAGKRNREPSQATRSFLEEILHSVFTFPAHDGDDDEDADEGEGSDAPGRRKLTNAEYDAAYSAQDDCDKLFTSCPRLF